MRSRLVVVSLCWCLAAGCVSYGSQALPGEKEAYPDYNVQDGLFFGVKVPADTEEVTRYFGVDLLSASVFPVMLCLENQSVSDSFDVAARGVSFQSIDGTELTRISPEEAHGAVAYSQSRSIIGFLFAVIPGFFIMSSVSSANEAMSDDYEGKHLKAKQPLHPGYRTTAAVFFRVPGGARLDDLRKGRVDLRATRRHSDGQSDVAIVIELYTPGT